MNLLLDFGNTRLKWACSETVADSGTAGSRILQRGVLDYDAPVIATWVAQLCALDIAKVVFASVVSAERESQVFATLAPAIPDPIRFGVMPQDGVLLNGYATQNTLGVDRWAAAIGAWGLFGQPCLIVGSGTATIIDLIDVTSAGNPIYRGGLILPGMDLMLQSLHERTARLPQAEGSYRAAPDVPDNTHDALISGAIEATCGAIERMGRRLPDDAPWLLTGGNAHRLLSALGGNALVVDDLVLEGLAISAQLVEQ